MKILNEGFPSASQSRERYIQVLKEKGYKEAHRQLLIELREYFKENNYTPDKIAEKADLFDGAFRKYAYDEDFEAVPDIKANDALFSEIFGEEGRKIVIREQARADADVRIYMIETGIEDEQEARRELVDGCFSAMEDFVDGHKVGGEKWRKEN